MSHMYLTTFQLQLNFKLSMFIVAKLGFTVATAGFTAWYARRVVIDNSSNEWEGQIKVYDYEKGKNVDMDGILNFPNGDIIDINILYKDASGSFNGALAKVIQFNHVTLILKTNNKEYWGIEKNSKMIHIQKSYSQNDIISKLDGIKRDSPLIYSNIAEENFLKKWKIKNNTLRNSFENEILINEIFSYINQNEIKIKFSYVENCQSFLQRILALIIKIQPNNITMYDYTSKRFMDLEDFQNNLLSNNLIYEIKSLTNSIQNSEAISFLIILKGGGYMSIDKNNRKIRMQLSHDENIILTKLNGIKRAKIMESFDTLLTFKYKDIYIKDLVNFIKRDDMTDVNSKEFMENIMEFSKSIKLKNSSSFMFYDCFQNKFQNLNVFIDKNNTRISEVSIWNKISQDVFPNISYEYCLVLILKTDNSDYWCLENINKTINVQKSTDEESLISLLNGSRRFSELNIIDISLNIIKENFQINDLLLFVMEFQLGIWNENSQDFIKNICKYLKLKDDVIPF